MRSEDGPSGPRAGFWTRFAAAFVDGALLAVVSLAIELGISRSFSFLDIVVGVAYFGYLEGSRSGQTIGKRMLGIRVIDFDNGEAIGFGRAVIRYFGRWVSAIAIFLGYFWMLWDRERRCWHDKFANNVVVPVSSYPVEHWPN
jgi:uncharacterized RDD family membrane protein YckC